MWSARKSFAGIIIMDEISAKPMSPLNRKLSDEGLRTAARATSKGHVVRIEASDRPGMLK
jgi:hypothetical protein